MVGAERHQADRRKGETTLMAHNGTDRFPEGSTLHICGPEGCAALAKHWTEASYRARALIVTEDDTDDDVFFILSGRARAATYSDSGKEVLMSDMSPGDSFGILAAIDGQPRSTNVSRSRTPGSRACRRRISTWCCTAIRASPGLSSCIWSSASANSRSE